MRVDIPGLTVDMEIGHLQRGENDGDGEVNRTMNKRRSSLGWGCALIVLLTIVSYLPALRCGFVWDDDAYVTENPLLTAPDGLKRIWFSAHRQSQYFPLVYTTLRFERKLWGLNPIGYHVVNVLLHGVNALLVWTVLRRLALPGAWLAAAIWAVHPVNVESVAWITELKNVQSTLLYLLALLAWMKFTDRGTVRPWRYYALALLLHALALFSKTTASTLPAAMLLVLWLSKESIGWRRSVQIAPFVVFGIAAGLLSVWWEAHLGNYSEELHFSFNALERLLIATHALWFYATKLVWPTNLTFSYARWEISSRDPLQYVWLIGCVAVALLLWWRRNTLGRAPVAAVVFFVAALAPVLGFIPLYTFRYSFVADHYQYVAGVGLIALFAATVSSHANTWQLGHNMRRALAVPPLLALGGLTWQQAGIYRDRETLWRDTLAKNSSNWMAHNNLGNLLASQGKVSEAVAEYTAALWLKPDFAEAHYNMGNALVSQGKLLEAVAEYREAVRVDPDYGSAHYNMGNALASQGKVSEAVAEYKEALRINPDNVKAHNNLGTALASQGKVSEAMAECAAALRINPHFAEAHYNWGNALLRVGKASEAIGHYEQALRLKPDYAEAQNNLGFALQKLGKVPEAIGHWEQALRLKPDYAEAYYNLGLALAGQGRLAEATAEYTAALRIKHDDAEAHYNLGNALFQRGNLTEAVQHFEQALRIKPDMAEARAKLQLAQQALTKLQEHGASGQR
jgi:tetratricopeptide (TPR) repeat protein